MSKITFRKYFVWVMTFLLVFTSVPMDFKAEANQERKKDQENRQEENLEKDKLAPKQAKEKKKEVIEERTDHTKVFDNGDGTFTKEIYFEPIHREDDGEWIEISPELHEAIIDNNPVIETKNTTLETIFPSEMQKGNYATFKKGEESISFSILKAEGESGSITSEDVTPEFFENEIHHKGIFPDINLRNITFDRNVKEDLVLESYKGYNIFTFRLQTDLEAKSLEDGSIAFFNGNEEEPAFLLPKPFMNDSNIDPLSAEAVRSDDVQYHIEKEEGQNSYLLTVTADEEWLKDPSRKYPVYIDPTTSLTTNSDAFVMSAYPSANYGTPTQKWDSSQNQYVLKVGYFDGTTGTNYSFLKQDISKLNQAVIDSATLNLYVTHSYYATTANGLWLDEVSQSWSATGVTWNNKPSSVNIGKVDVARDQWTQFNVLNTVKGWASGAKPNYGFKLHANGNGQAFWKKVVSADNSSLKPYLSVTYHYNAPAAPTVTAVSNGSGTGTGYLNVNWTKVPGATSYKVLIFNGKEYEAINVGDVSSWTTKGKKLWPTNAQIDAGEYRLKTNGTGTEFAFNPNPVYQNAALDGGSYATRRNYAIRVVAVYPGGDSPYSGAAVPYMPMEKPKAPFGRAYPNAQKEASGYVNLEWEPVEGADGYKILMFNGKSYEQVGSVAGTQLSWTTQHKGLWPTQQQIELGRYALNLDGSGAELAIDPSPVYNNANSGYQGRTNYWFRIKAYSNAGHPESGQSDAFMPTIPGADTFLGMEDYWTGIPVESGTVNAATGNFILSETDISIDGRGTGLNLGRTYNSQSSNVGLFGYGWHSDAEMTMQQVGNEVKFTDEDGTIHRFIKQVDGTYKPPTGVYLELKETTTEYILTSKDQSNVYFDKSTGTLRKIVDGHKNETIYTWNQNRLESIKDASSRLIKIEYNTAGFISKLIDPKQRIISFDYKGDLLEFVTNAQGEKTKYEYDEIRRLHKLYSPTHTSTKPVVTVYSYDENENIIKDITNPKGKVTVFSYNLPNRTLIVTNPKGNRTFYSYNEAANPIKVINGYNPEQPTLPNSNLETQYDYKGNNLEKTWDPKDIGKVATESYQYDSNGNVVNAVDAYGTETYQYNKNNDVISYTDTENKTTTIAYDGLNPISETDEAGAVSSVSKFDAHGNEVESSDALSAGTNMAANTSFEGSLTGWTTTNSKDSGQVSLISVPANERLTLGGQQAVKMTTQSTTTANELGAIYVAQEIAVTPNTTYTLSSKIKTVNLKNAKAFLNVQMLNGTTHVGWVDNRYSSLTGSNPWTDRQVTFKTSSTVNKVKVLLEIDHRNNTTSGEAWFDLVQLEQSDVSSLYNPLTNSSFENGITGWTGSGGSIDNTESAFDGNQSLKFSRTSTGQAAVQYRQSLVLNQEAGNPKPITLTGMSKALDVKNTVDNAPNRDYSLWAKIHYVDGDVDDIQSYYPLGTQEWNRGAIYINPAKAIKSVDAYLIFRGNNTGTVWFDAIRVLEGNILSRSEYDLNKNYPEKVYDVLGRKTEKIYDEVGNVKEEINPKGVKKVYAYDLMKRLKALTLPTNTVVSYSYDDNGNMQSKTIDSSVDAKTQTFTYHYDEDDKLTEVIDPLNKRTSYEYDDNGNKTKTVLPNNNVIESTYDDADRLDKIYYNNQLTYEFIKDKNSNETTIIDHLNALKKERIFDSKNRVTSQKISKNSTLIGSMNWNYPADSDKLSSISFSHNETNQAVNYEYNKLDQNTAVKIGSLIHRFDYDERGNVKTYTPANGAGTSYVYDEAGQVISAYTGSIHPSTGEVQTIFQERYSYDLNGNREKIIYSNGASTQYEYDELDQLRKETLPDGTINEYRYDGFGNRTYIKEGTKTAISPTYNLANQLKTFGSESIEYDDNGNRISDGEFDYKWNAADQLIAVHRKGEATPFAEYKYDDDGRRIQKNVSGTVTNYIYNGDSLNVLYETNASEQVLRSYIYGVDGQLLAMNKHSGNTKTDTYYYHYNPRGDVIGLTDQSGNIVAGYQYDSWGNHIKSESRTGITLENPYRYAGYQFDEETGLYYLMARYYNSKHGVFISLDPDPGDDDDILTQNGYTYANNNPIMLVDPDGRFPWLAINAAFAAYAGYKAYKSGKNWKNIAYASAFAFVGGTRIKAAKTGIIYLRTNPLTKKQYIGRANSRTLYKARQWYHNRKHGVKHNYQELLKVRPGRQARRYEQKMINRYGGPGKYGGRLENSRHEISRKKWKRYNI